MALLNDPVYWLTACGQRTRHMHEDEEIRYFLSGSGFFDVRGACVEMLKVLILNH